MSNAIVIEKTGAPTFEPGNCRTCGCALNDPHRRWVNYAITEGCVAADHTGKLPIDSLARSQKTRDWHNRAAAKAIRKASREYLRKLLAA